MTRLCVVGVPVDTTARILEIAETQDYEFQEVHRPPSDVTAAALMATRPTVVILGDKVPGELRTELTETVDTEYPESVVIWATHTTGAALKEAMVCGARDVFAPDAAIEDLRSVLSRAVSLGTRRFDRTPAVIEETADQAQGGRLIVVVSPKGGSGKTMLSTNLSAALSKLVEGDVVLVDLDLQFGDDAAALGLRPQFSMADAVGAVDDSTALKAMLAPHESGFYLLAAPTDPVTSESISSQAVSGVLEALRQEFSHVIVDTGAGLDDPTITAIGAASDVIFITTNDLAAINALNKVLVALDQLKMTDHRRYYVLNRADSDVGVRRRDIEEVTGLAVDVTIPSTKQVPTSMNQGRPVVDHHRRSSVAKSLVKVAELLLPKERKVWGSR